MVNYFILFYRHRHSCLNGCLTSPHTSSDVGAVEFLPLYLYLKPKVAEYLRTHEEAKFTPTLVRSYPALADQGNRQPTIEGKLTTIKELYRFIRLRTEYGDQLALDPIELDSITPDKYNTPAKIEREALTREEVRRLFDAMDNYRNRL